MKKMNKTQPFTPRNAVLAAALLAVSHLSHAALPATAAGALDPTFNGGAPVVQSMSTISDFPQSIAVQPDGRVVVAGYGAAETGAYPFGFVVRRMADGSLDPGFGTAGVVKMRSASEGTSFKEMVLLADGRMLIAGAHYSGDPKNLAARAALVRLNADGSPDATFGTGGMRVTDCPGTNQCYYQGLVQLADGSSVALGSFYDATYTNAVAFLDRFDSAGVPMPGFGANGRRMLPAALDGFDPEIMSADAQGRLLVTGKMKVAGVQNGVLLRFTADGALDAAFAAGGMMRLAIEGLKTTFGRAAVQPDGRIVVAADTYDPKSAAGYAARALRFDAGGAPDPTFGTAGIATPLPGYFTSVAAQADGRLLFVGGDYTDHNQEKTIAMRLLPDGKPDTAFGTGGKTVIYASGINGAATLALGADDRAVVAAYGEPTGQYFDTVVARVIGTETTSNVVEFYNGTLNHYFVTANADEAAAIDGGAAGPGWSRTGEAWKSGGPARVCRFYGSPEVDAATGLRRGPNGHFYTISADECAIVKTDAGWKFESYDFSGWPKQADGSCAAGTQPVKRAYNNRFAVNDSNHRYTTSDVAYAAMLAAGWSGEGTVFCAPL